MSAVQGKEKGGATGVRNGAIQPDLSHVFVGRRQRAERHGRRGAPRERTFREGEKETAPGHRGKLVKVSGKPGGKQRIAPKVVAVRLVLTIIEGSERTAGFRVTLGTKGGGA